MSQTFMIWDGNGRFWCGDGSGENGKSGRRGEWVEDPKIARVWSSHLDAWAFSADVGGQVVTGAQAGELLSERAVLVRQWEVDGHGPWLVSGESVRTLYGSLQLAADLTAPSTAPAESIETVARREFARAADLNAKGKGARS